MLLAKTEKAGLVRRPVRLAGDVQPASGYRPHLENHQYRLVGGIFIQVKFRVNAKVPAKELRGRWQNTLSLQAQLGLIRWYWDNSFCLKTKRRLFRLRSRRGILTEEFEDYLRLC